MCRAELQHEVQDVEELRRGLLFRRRERLDEIDDRCRVWWGCAKERRQRLRLVAGLHFLHVVEVAWIEQLRAKASEDKLRLRANHFLHAFGQLALPVRAGDEIATASVAGGAAADIGKVEGVGVD